MLYDGGLKASNSYFISTVGGAPLEGIKQYIENQQVSESPKAKAKWKAYIEAGQK
jgi:putative transposase